MIKNALFFALAACLLGCGPSAKEKNERLVSNVKSEIIRLNEVKRLDSEAVDYIEQCKKSGDFRAQARIVPLLSRAVVIGAISPNDAELHYRQMLARGGESASYWKKIIENLHKTEAVH